MERDKKQRNRDRGEGKDRQSKTDRLKHIDIGRQKNRGTERQRDRYERV
jgi:hypothetical protein